GGAGRSAAVTGAAHHDHQRGRGLDNTHVQLEVVIGDGLGGGVEDRSRRSHRHHSPYGEKGLWPPGRRVEPRAAQPRVGQEIVTAPYVFSMTAASAGIWERSLPAGQYLNVGGASWRPSRSHAWICSTIAVAASSPSRP